MYTELDERVALIKTIDKLGTQDCQRLYLFLIGLEAGKKAAKEDTETHKRTSQSPGI